VIQNGGPVPHPIHLHGHNFYRLGASDADTSSNSNTSKIFSKDNIDDLNFKNPTRRDVTMLPGNGWVVIAFITNNPGAWLMHCHIAWHVAEGLGVQFLERASEIEKNMDLTKTEENCAAWHTWFGPRMGLKIDSGL
jgi:FtsP/CotA-like multicopper oxidase with cupredoxin domain